MPYPGQPAEGPGGANYDHAAVEFFDGAVMADGYWLFEPRDPMPDSAEVVVFLHGYGAYNPMAYGKWIKHLVGKGNIVIYPRYQKNLVWPRPFAFPRNAAKGIRDALKALEKPGHVKPRVEKISYIGHSYGAVTAANLGVHWEKYRIPKPASMLLCTAGSGPFKGARLHDYSGLPADMPLALLVEEDDYVVGSEFSELVFRTAVNTPERELLLHRKSNDGKRQVSASHGEPYCLDLDFDTGIRNFTALRVLNISKLDEIDFYGYWKLADGLMDYTRLGINRAYALGNTPQQQYLGRWENGHLIRPLLVIPATALEEAPTPRSSAYPAS